MLFFSLLERYWFWDCNRLPLLHWGMFLFLSLSRSFMKKWCWILSASNEMVIWFQTFSMLLWWVNILNHTCITGLKPPWSWWTIFLDIFLNLNYKFSENLFSYVHNELYYIIFFYVASSCNFFTKMLMV